MKKLTLDQLEVENFATQPSQDELSNVKGGTSYPCIKLIWDVAKTVFTSNTSSSSGYSGPYFHVTDSTALQIKGKDTLYIHTHTYKFGVGH